MKDIEVTIDNRVIVFFILAIVVGFCIFYMNTQSKDTLLLNNKGIPAVQIWHINPNYIEKIEETDRFTILYIKEGRVFVTTLSKKEIEDRCKK